MQPTMTALSLPTKSWLAALLLVGTTLVAQGARCPYQRSKTCHDTLRSLIYINGQIYTADPQDDPDWASHPHSAMVMEDGVITYLGSDSGALALERPGVSRVKDLRGSAVLPGIHDVHMHPLEAFNDVGATCILPADRPLDSRRYRDILSRCFTRQVGTDWILGWGHDFHRVLEYLDSGKRDPRLILDDLMRDEDDNPLPVIIMERTSHSMWVSSEALRRAGIDRDSQDTPGGIIMKNDDGEPNGILLENAGNAIMELAQDPTEYPGLRTLSRRALNRALKQLAKNGITSVVDARSYWTREHDKAWERFENRDRLTVKAILAMWAYPEKDDSDQLARLRDLYTNNTNSLLRKCQIKVYVDGITHQTTAAFLEDYNINLGILPENKGMNYFDQTRLTKYIRELQNIDSDGGYDFLIHAIGDRGVREALNAIEATRDQQETERRHRLTHVEHVDDDDIGRFAQLGVVADAQVAGTFTLPTSAAFDDLVATVGVSRARGLIPIRSLQAAGARVTLSSDYDVSSMNPFQGMQHAVTRGDESVDLQAAVEMYTINAAYSMRQEKWTGSLTVGKDADVIVLDRNIFSLPKRDIKRTKVKWTLLEGREVWRA